MMDTLSPRFFRRVPTDPAVMPLPREETTPLVMKTYFAIACRSSGHPNSDSSKSPCPKIQNGTRKKKLLVPCRLLSDDINRPPL